MLNPNLPLVLNSDLSRNTRFKAIQSHALLRISQAKQFAMRGDIFRDLNLNRQIMKWNEITSSYDWSQSFQIRTPSYG